MHYRKMELADTGNLGKAYVDAFAMEPFKESWTVKKAVEHIRDHLQRHPDTCWVIYRDRPDKILGAALGEQLTPSRWVIRECFFPPEEGKKALGDQFVRTLFQDLRQGGSSMVELFIERTSPDYAFMRGFGMRTPSHLQMLTSFKQEGKE